MLRRVLFLFFLLPFLPAHSQVKGEIGLYKAYFFKEGQDLSKPLESLDYSLIKKGKEVEIISVDTSDVYHSTVKYKGKKGIIHNSVLSDRRVLIPFFTNLRNEYLNDISNGVLKEGMNESEVGFIIGIQPKVQHTRENVVRWYYPNLIDEAPDFLFYKGKLCSAEMYRKVIFRYYTTFKFSLKSVEINGVIKEVSENKNNEYEDEYIKINWEILQSALSFNLLNKTDGSLKVLWNDMSFTDISNNSRRVVSGETRVIHANFEIPSSVIPKGSSLSEIAVPYPRKSFIVNYYLCPQELEDSGKPEIGKEIKILFPIEFGGKVKEYIFTFTVSDIILLRDNSRK